LPGAVHATIRVVGVFCFSDIDATADGTPVPAGPTVTATARSSTILATRVAAESAAAAGDALTRESTRTATVDTAATGFDHDAIRNGRRIDMDHPSFEANVGVLR
jgi:hypothetical protein